MNEPVRSSCNGQRPTSASGPDLRSPENVAPLVVWLGSDLTLRLGLLISALSAFALAFLVSRRIAEDPVAQARVPARALGAGALAILAILIAVAAPRWSTRLIDLGPTIYGRRPMNRPALDAFLANRGERLLAFKEGWNATVSVWESAHNRYLKVNGKTDASDFADMDTQVVVGLAATAARPDAKSALIIGYGSGVSAGVVAAIPGMARVKIVELERLPEAAEALTEAGRLLQWSRTTRAVRYRCRRSGST